VEVSRATLHNQDEIDRKDVRIGTRRHSEGRRCDPEVVQVVREKRTGQEKKFRIPDLCPVCGSEVDKPEGEAVARCTGVACPASSKRPSSTLPPGSPEHRRPGEKIIAQLVERV